MSAAYLLDTHALIWWWLSDRNLSEAARRTIGERNARVFVSAVSAFEIALNVRTGRLPAMAEPLALFDEATVGEGMIHLPVDYRHARHAGLLPGEHRDPFDRMIAAQALVEGMPVVTRDPVFAALGCAVVW